MHARISMLALALLVGVAVIGSAASAQVRAKEKVGFAVTGEITAVDAAAKSITVKSTNDAGVVYKVDDTASIMSGGKKVGLGELSKGMSVVMNGQDDGTHKVATYIKVVKAP